MKTSSTVALLFFAAGLLHAGCGSSGTGPSTGSGGSGSGGTAMGSGGSGSGGAAPVDGGPGDVADSGPGEVGSGDTWDSWAKGFFTTYCVACHNDDNSGVAARDYHMLANVMREKAEIACGTAKSAADRTNRNCAAFPPARQFPVGGGPKPSDADRDRLLKWIDAGTP